MNRSEKKALVEDFEQRILRCVEEIDDSYFIDDVNKQIIVDFVEKKINFTYIEVNVKTEDVGKVVFIFRHETEEAEDLKKGLFRIYKMSNYL